mgnify:CR=1 FL=1
MSLFIQSANALVSRVAQWVGALPQTLTVTATAVNTTTGVITTSADPSSLVQVGDFIGNSVFKPYAAVLAVSSTTITVSDPDATWAGLTLPSVIYKFPTQSTVEILQCIQQAELKMRTIELPALRTNPYGSSPSVFTTNSDGMVPIPADMVDEVNEWRQHLVEAVAEYDDKILEKYFEDPNSISVDEIRNAIRRATIDIAIIPMMICSIVCFIYFTSWDIFKSIIFCGFSKVYHTI